MASERQDRRDRAFLYYLRAAPERKAEALQRLREDVTLERAARSEISESSCASNWCDSSVACWACDYRR